MKVLELFAGTRSIGRAFERKGHEVFSVEWDRKHPDIDLYIDIGKLTSAEILEKFGKPDVVWMSPDCFVAKTPVWTDVGYKNIEDLAIGDLVLTHNGNYKRVTATIRKESNSNRRIKISGCLDLVCTSNHPFYARKKALCYPRIDGKRTHRIKMLEPEWVKAEDLTTDYRVGIPINRNAIIPAWNGYFNKKYRIYENKISEKLGNADFWWIVGRYFADGCLSMEKRTVELCCGKKRDSKVSDHLIAAGIKYTVNEKQTSRAYLLCSTELCLFLSRYGKGAKNKKLMKEILDLPVELLRNFIDGYLSGDGHLDSASSGPSKVWTFSSISKDLVQGMQMALLKAYGRYGSIIYRAAEKQKGMIEGRKVNVNDSWSCSFRQEGIEKRLQYVVEDGIAWVNVRKNEPEPGISDVFCVSVEDDESFTANNVAVHNCTSFSVAAISHHRNGIEPKTDYAKFCDAVDAHCMDLLRELKPTYYFIENPAGMFQHMPYLKKFLDETGGRKHLLCYCKYSDPWTDENGVLHMPRKKPTHIFTNHPNPRFIPPCKNGDPCHEKAPRGSRTGTQGLKNAVERSRIPDRLCDHIVEICESVPEPEGIDAFIEK